MPKPRILVTRSPHQTSELSDTLRALGAEPILIPTIETVEPITYAPLDAAFARFDTFHWLLFTSANAVEAFHKRLPQGLKLGFVGGMDGRAEARPLQGLGDAEAEAQVIGGGVIGVAGRSAASLRAFAQNDSVGVGRLGVKIAAIGAATARALEAAGFSVDLTPAQAVAESLTEALLPQALQPDGSPTRFLLVRAEQAREHLPETLRVAGGEVTVVPAYRTVTPDGSLEALRALLSTNPPDAVTFTSSSTARNLFELLATGGVALPEGVVRASIGPITSQTLRELGHPPHVEAEEASVGKLAEAVVGFLARR